MTSTGSGANGGELLGGEEVSVDEYRFNGQ